MSTTISHTVIMGVDVSKVELPDEIHDKYYKENDGLMLTGDCNGNCMILGKIIVRATDEEGGMNFTVIDYSDYHRLKSETIALLQKHDLWSLMPKAEFGRSSGVKLFAFSEWA